MTIVWGILGLGFLVFFHELGHFIAARLCGVTVEAFSVGMGPVLLHHRHGATDYRLSLVPLGGYCGMKGEADYRAALEEGRSEIRGEPDSFYGVHPLRRLLIAFAGPFFNVLFAYVAFVIIAMAGYTYYTAGTMVLMADEVEEYQNQGSPAHEAGMRSGDTIMAVNGRAVADFSDIAAAVGTHGGHDVTISVMRGETQMDIPVHVQLDTATGLGRIGIVAMEGSVAERHYGPFPFPVALVEGARQAGRTVSLTVWGISMLFKGVDITRAVSGPARITTMVGDTVRSGFREGIRVGIVSTLELLALISVSLFLTNLLPVPVLDGGLILFALIEWAARRKMHPRLLYYIQYVGIAFIAALMVIAIAGDVRYFFFQTNNGG